MEEIWKDVPEWEDCYQVSTKGRVRSKDRYVRTNRGSKRIVKGEIKSLYKTKDGYLSTHFRDYKTQRSKTMRVHRVVAMTFIVQPKDKNEIDHINGIRDDNRVENLRWCTNKENSSFPLARKNKSIGIKNALKKNPHIKQLITNNLMKVRATPIIVYKNGLFFKEFPTQREAERYFGYTQGLINKYLKGRRVNKDGYTFEYKGRKHV